MIRKAVLAVERWMDDESALLALGKTGLVFGLVLVLIIAPFLWMLVRQQDSAMETCLRSGGAWAVVGSHTRTGFIMSGKVRVPTTTRVQEYGCVTWRDRTRTDPNRFTGNPR